MAPQATGTEPGGQRTWSGVDSGVFPLVSSPEADTRAQPHGAVAILALEGFGSEYIQASTLCPHSCH